MTESLSVGTTGSAFTANCLAFHSSNESSIPSSTGSVGVRGFRQHIGSDGGFLTCRDSALKASLWEVFWEKTGKANRSARSGGGRAENILLGGTVYHSLATQ